MSKNIVSSVWKVTQLDIVFLFVFSLYIKIIAEMQHFFFAIFRDQLAGERLKLTRQFFDERWSKHRTITSLDWSIQVS